MKYYRQLGVRMTSASEERRREKRARERERRGGDFGDAISPRSYKNDGSVLMTSNHKPSEVITSHNKL